MAAEDVYREGALAVALGPRQHLVLTRVSLLALDVPVGRPRQHGRRPRQQAVTGVDLVAGPARDHEEGDSIADFRGPARLLVETRPAGRLRGAIPDHSVALVG